MKGTFGWIIKADFNQAVEITSIMEELGVEIVYQTSSIGKLYIVEE